LLSSNTTTPIPVPIPGRYGDPTYRRLPACSSCSPCECPRADAPAWCNVPFDPEGSVASLAAVGSLFFGAFVGHVLMDTKV
jgi:hypothetical protein